MKMNKLKKLVSVAFAFCAATLCAGTPKNLTLTGEGPSAVWDIGKTAVWSDGENVTTYADGDAVLIDSAFTGNSVLMSDRLSPSGVTIDIATGRILTFGWSNANYGLSANTGAFAKKGDGVLILSSTGAVSSGQKGNDFVCDANILGGEVYLKDANSWQLFGSSTVEHWVRVHSGASFSFSERNQSGTPANGSALDIELSDLAVLNFHTNYSAGTDNLCNTLKWLKFTGASVLRYGGWNKKTGQTSTGAFAYVCDGLHFSGTHVHDFSKSFYQATGPTAGGSIALPADKAVTFRVDEISGDDDVDAVVNLNAFVWAANAAGENAVHIVKDGPGTIDFKSMKKANAAATEYYYGDITVAGGTAVFSSQGLLPCDPEPGHERVQTLMVSNNATLCFEYRNVMAGTALSKPPLKIEINHATFKFTPTTGGEGWARAREWVFDDANLVVTNAGLSAVYGVWGFLDRVTFDGSKPYNLDVNMSVSANCQAIHVGYSPRTEIIVNDITGDALTDVTFSMPIKNTATNGNANIATAVSGFVKKGSGTLAVASSSNKLSGDVTVSEGTLRVDGVLNTPHAIEIEAGGRLGGTGTVAKVSLAADAGFEIRLADKGHALTIQGDLALPSSGVIVLDAPADQIGKTRLKIAHVTGTVSGASDLSGWKLKDVSGTVIRAGDALSVRNGDLYLRGGGFVMVVR